MKIRQSFVSNSSSTSFTITNTSSEIKTLVDFAKENDFLRKEFCVQYDWHDFSYEEMIKSAEKENITFLPGETVDCIFGDEQRTTVGCVYDYMLRNGGVSENFRWRLVEYLR